MPVGRRRLDAREELLRAHGVAARQAGLRAAGEHVLRFVVGRPLEPQLGARPVAGGEIQVRELEEGVAARLAASLGDREGAGEGVADVARGPARVAARAAEADPHLGAGRGPPRELFERQRELRVELGRLAGIGEQREADRRIGRASEDAPCSGAGAHRVALGERVFSFA